MQSWGAPPAQRSDTNPLLAHLDGGTAFEFPLDVGATFEFPLDDGTTFQFPLDAGTTLRHDNHRVGHYCR